ncbi:hypothetical protein KJ758_02435 [Patescibacteria group bacterium]|nr:hypothetical protein [Patescibacteria group bacterium]
MNYIQSRSQLKQHHHSSPDGSGRWWLLVIIFFLIVLALIIIILKAPAEVEEVIEETDPVQEILSESASQPAFFEEITLESVGDGSWSGVARRGEEDGLFTHVIVATLPPINTSSQYYEGWLVKPRVVEFFSTGEMFARADGKWGLVWEVKKDEAILDLDDYVEVVITLEDRDGDEAPSAAHVLEGKFEKK